MYFEMFLDFEELYPGKQNLLLHLWPTLEDKIIDLAARKLKTESHFKAFVEKEVPGLDIIDTLRPVGEAAEGVNALTPVQLEQIKNHIANFPLYKSHYRRSESESEFLAPDMNLVKMYELYVEDMLGEEDTCQLCDSLAAQLASANGEARKTLEERQKDRYEQWQFARAEMQRDKVAAQKDQSLD
ncbi:unnamed protein product [Bemisia tabaci]|uniref:Uncharacterized protein n=1 Tax=Bemisia tabaci TaxID=7038 RepID=A0A9P0A7X4_BEMTA|nr:unnamed protein product [Bemisia tabaci]